MCLLRRVCACVCKLEDRIRDGGGHKRVEKSVVEYHEEKG
jgi:hypothetical protein